MSGELAVVVCTYRRPELLRACLLSLASQGNPAGLAVRVYVVDNSDDGSAAAVVEQVARASPIPMRWIEAHPANISVARNAGVAASTEAVVAFVDDDTTCDAGWLAAVAAGLENYPQDVFMGGVEGEFETPEMVSPALHNLFSRQMVVPAGTDLYAFGPLRKSESLSTNNSIFRRKGTLDEVDPFDVAFGQSGGEDVDLLCRLQRRGRRFGWLPGAVVRETVPKARCDARYLRRRFFTGGQSYAAAISRGGSNVQLTRWWIRLKAAVQLALLLAALPAALAGGRNGFTDYSYRIAGVLGKLSFGASYPLYRRHEPDPRAAPARYPIS